MDLLIQHLTVHHNEAYDRSGAFESQFFSDQAIVDFTGANDIADLTPQQIADADDQLVRLNSIDRNRAILGSAENTNGGIFINAGRSVNEVWDFYTFGGVSRKRVIGGVFTREAGDGRNVPEIFPNGFNPETPSILTDWQLVGGVKAKLAKDWNFDFSAGYSGNDLQLFNRNTVNPSLGANSPTQFFTGALNVTQTTFNADVQKLLSPKTTLAFGSELRFESFQQSQGDAESFQAGPLAASNGVDVGSSGREGFSSQTDGEFFRNNFGFYTEIESDITDEFIIRGSRKN